MVDPCRYVAGLGDKHGRNTSFTPLHFTPAARGQQPAHAHARNVCEASVDDGTYGECEDWWAGVYRWFAYPAATADALVAAAANATCAQSSNNARNPHGSHEENSTQRSDRVLRLRRLDSEWLESNFEAMETATGCPLSKRYSPARQQARAA